MKTTKSLLLILLILFTVLLSCKKSSTATLYTPTSDDVTSTATLDELQQGRTLYINNCGSCHQLYSPDDYTATQWKGIMPGMASSARLTSAQTTLVTKYVTRGH
jgi:mono/diheme cytochrome c family protein